MASSKVPINSLIINDGLIFKGPDDTEEEAYVLTLADQSKQKFSGVRASDKQPINWKPTDLVIKINVEGVGPVLLSL